jgi:hypothetical protein
MGSSIPSNIPTVHVPRTIGGLRKVLSQELIGEFEQDLADADVSVLPDVLATWRMRAAVHTDRIALSLLEDLRKGLIPDDEFVSTPARGGRR